MWRQGELTLKAPGGLSQLEGARAPRRGPDKGAEVLGGERRSRGQSGYVKLELAAPRSPSEGPQAMG